MDAVSEMPDLEAFQLVMGEIHSQVGSPKATPSWKATQKQRLSGRAVTHGVAAPQGEAPLVATASAPTTPSGVLTYASPTGPGGGDYGVPGFARQPAYGLSTHIAPPNYASPAHPGSLYNGTVQRVGPTHAVYGAQAADMGLVGLRIWGHRGVPLAPLKAALATHLGTDLGITKATRRFTA